MMKRQSHTRTVVRLLLPIFLLLASGCDTSGPEFAGGDTRIVEGALAGEIATQSDFFAITRTGTVNILLTSLSEVDKESGEPVESPIIAVSVGQPDPTDETLCQLTFSEALAEGESFSVFFIDGLYCLNVFRVPSRPTETIIEFSITMAGAFS